MHPNSKKSFPKFFVGYRSQLGFNTLSLGSCLPFTGPKHSNSQRCNNLGGGNTETLVPKSAVLWVPSRYLEVMDTQHLKRDAFSQGTGANLQVRVRQQVCGELKMVTVAELSQYNTKLRCFPVNPRQDSTKSSGLIELLPVISATTSP